MVAEAIYKRKHFYRDLIIATLIMILPFIIYLHLLFPTSKIYKTLLFTIESNYYQDVQVMIWV